MSNSSYKYPKDRFKKFKLKEWHNSCCTCGNDYLVEYLNRKIRKYCSRKCSNSDPLKKSVLAQRMKETMFNLYGDRRGVKNPSSKLTEEQVEQIRILLAMDVKQKRIAKDSGVAPSTISGIKNNKRWIV